MERRDAYRRPEVFAFLDARMLGALVTTSRSARQAARECDAWQAIARRMHERPAYFGGVPGSDEHRTSLRRLYFAPEYYEVGPQLSPRRNISNRLTFISQFIRAHAPSIRILDGNLYNPEHFEFHASRMLRDIGVGDGPGEEFVVLIGRTSSDPLTSMTVRSAPEGHVEPPPGLAGGPRPG